MRALLVNHRYYPFRGGSEIYIQKLAEWFARSGWDVRVVTTDAFDLEYFWERRARAVDAAPHETLNGVDVVRVPVRHRPGGKYTFGATRRGMGEASRVIPFPAPFRAASRFVPHLPALREALLDFESPDVVIATNLAIEGPAIVARELAEMQGAPFVLIPFAHLGDEGESTARRYVSMPHQRELVQSADLVLAMTNLEARFLREAGAKDLRIAVVGAGLHPIEVTGGNKQHFELLFGVDAFVIGSLGALAADKGTPDLIDASEILRERGVLIELVLAGPELSAFENWMRRRGADRWPWVHRPGVIDDEAKRDLLAGIDVLALPSRTESFGIVFLEAWANMKPVVGAAVGAVNEIVRDGEDGLLVPFGDPVALADVLERLAGDRDLRWRLGVAGREKLEAHYTWDRVLGAIGDAFESVLGLRVTGAGDGARG